MNDFKNNCLDNYNEEVYEMILKIIVWIKY